MSTRQKSQGSPFLYDETTGDIVGLKDPDGSEFYFARAADYAYFSDSNTQTALANTPTVMSFDTPVITDGITLSGGTKFVMPRGGKYMFTLTAQILNNDTSIHNFYLWGRMNGTDIPGTATRVCVTSRHGGKPGAVVLERSYMASLSDGDYIEIVWMTDDAQVSLVPTPASVSPAMPGGPSLVLMISEVAA